MPTDHFDGPSGPVFAEMTGKGKHPAASISKSGKEHPNLAGTVLGEWHVLHRRSEHARWTDYDAERRDPHRQRGVLRILFSAVDSPDAREQLRHYRNHLVHLKHPNIPRLLDDGETRSGEPFFVFEHFVGETLDHALFEAAMANGGDPPDTFGMSGMQLVQARFGQFTFGGRSPPVAMNLPSTTRGTWSLEYIRGGDSYVNGSFDGGATMETGGRRTEGSYYWIFRRSACIGTAEQCGNSSFFRDNFFGRTLSSALGDPLARFNDGTNPISGAGLSPGQQFDAQFLGLASIATAGIPAASTTRGVSALVTKTEGLILTHGRTLSKAAFAARQLGMRQVPAEEVDLPYLGYRSVADFFDRGW